MKDLFFLLTLFYFNFCFIQAQVKLEVKNQNVKYKSFSYEQLNENTFKISITDENDEQITGLTKNDFRVVKNKKEGEILEIIPLSKIGDTKIRLGLLIDNSFSMKPFVDDVLLILDDMINSLGKGFYVSVVMFDETIDNVTKEKNKLFIRKLPFTKDINRIKDYYKYGLKFLSNGTYLYDAMKASFNSFTEDTLSKVEKNIIVILSDGLDVNSSTSLKEIEKIDKSKFIIYAIDFMHSTRESGRRNEALERFAKETKGEYYSPDNIKALGNIFRKISTKIVNLGYELKYQFKYPNPKITYNFDEKELLKRPDNYKNFSGLLLEEIKVKESFPLLNYVFFDKNSDSLPKRYITFTSSEEATNFSENNIQGGAIEHYYNMLNIIGERLKNNPSSVITIIGTTDGIEKNWKNLAINRANRIKKYFCDIWQIDSSRISIKSQKLPDKPSTKSTNEGKEENRRVEIISNDWNIMKPVTFIQNLLNITPTKIEINASGGDSVNIEEMNINITNNDKQWNSFLVKNQNQSTIIFNWKNRENILPNDSDLLSIKCKVIDNGLDEAISDEIVFPVKKITSEISKSENISEKKIEKVSLILFDFDSYNPGEKNEKIMNEYVYPKLTDTTLYILINGYTDNIGKPDYNLKLSNKRAEVIFNALTTKYSKEKVNFFGYGANSPLYTNYLPEGRFYNRTVQLILQNFKNE